MAHFYSLVTGLVFQRQRVFCLPVVIGRLSVHLSAAAAACKHPHHLYFSASSIVDGVSSTDRHKEMDLSMSRGRIYHLTPHRHHHVQHHTNNNFRFIYYFRFSINNFRFF